MTRYLPHVLEDIPYANLNEQTERLFAYHQATKHTYRSVRANAHYLDWNNQPNPFRTYEDAPVTLLEPEPGFPSTGTFAAMAALGQNPRFVTKKNLEDRGPVKLDSIWLSRLLWHSMAVSAWKKVPRTGDRYSLRVNPSSGNLHPTETHLALHNFIGVENGLYHYRADSHALELRSRGAWTQHLARALGIAWTAEPSLIVGLTSIFWREAWKYRDRAYRYCCHDLGHAMMSLLLAARALGMSGRAITHFADSRLTQTLGLSGGDEAPMAFLIFGSQNSSDQISPAPEEIFLGVPNKLSAEEMRYEVLLGIHRATLLDETPGLPQLTPANAAVASDQHPIAEVFDNPARDASLGSIVRRRRSALDFDPKTPPMERSEIEQLLGFSTRDWRADWRGNFSGETKLPAKGTDYIDLYVYVHRVRDCESGVYRWNANLRKLEQLHQGNVERVAAFLSLEQGLAGNACFAVSMIADLAVAAQMFGNRGYRYVFFEAGAIGQRLYLGAEALGWNATGIGAFYDDDVHRYLGLLEETNGSVINGIDAAEKAALVMLGSPASRHAATQNQVLHERVAENSGSNSLPADSSKLPRQVIYHFAVGRAIPDPRLEA